MKWIALGLLSSVALAYLMVVPGSTDRRLLRPGPLRATARSWRGLGQRLVTALAGWPYLALRALGLGRHPAPGMQHEDAWRLGPVHLRRYQGDGPRSPVLIVHSFISQPTILDLAPGRSVIGALTAAGHDVFLLDWGQPGPAQAATGFEGYVATVQLAVDAVLALGRASRVPVVGYCMGAALALAADSDRPGTMSGIFAIAPPGDLSVDGGLHRLLRRTAFRPAWVLNGQGLVPGPVVRESFHGLRPDVLRGGWRAWRSGRKNPHQMALTDGRARWAFDQPALPGGVLFDLVDMARANSLLGRVANASAPTVLAVAERDHIVPSRSSLALTARPGVEVLHVASGHAAMVTGSDAPRSLYPAMVRWLASLEQRAEASTTVSA